MRDVVIIGGGLSGLAAAWELEQSGVSYTLIEVKPRLGGSIHTVRVNGFCFDSGPMAHHLTNPSGFEAYLVRLGLSEQVTVTDDGRLAFIHGTHTLVETLAAQITAPVMRRMAVSTLGIMEPDRYSICLENGMLLDARALIVAAPARYAERMFYTLTPEISHQLLDYRYDTITRISAGYTGPGYADLNVMYPPDAPIADTSRLTHPARLPDAGGAIVQAALRIEPGEMPQDPVGELAALMRWPLNPDADHIATWTESDPVMWRMTDHIRRMTTIRALLPQGVALAGSDYVHSDGPPRLDERVQQGQTAADRVLAYLRR
ncbi:MAG: FAD-dependent oxidoreductase [Chloroflexota bacterium]